MCVCVCVGVFFNVLRIEGGVFECVWKRKTKLEQERESERESPSRRWVRCRYGLNTEGVFECVWNRKRRGTSVCIR